MFSKGYTSNKPHVKSAKVDGGVIASWHPHGSEYSTFTRMSQPWLNNICEVNWHGANGSQIGGPEPAAARYTECRLDKAAEDGFFANIKKNVVDYQLNFSEDLEWPIVFPAILPRLFVNGSDGIGYGFSQRWEPGNLKEFTEKVKLYLQTGKVNCNDIYPDYPSGGTIVNKAELHTIYETGKGLVKLRAKAEIVGSVIKITELPYQVYVGEFIEKVKKLVNSSSLTGIEDIYNKSDDNGLLIEIECSDDPNIVLNKLFKLTKLQSVFTVNQIALLNGKPELFTLESYIKAYVEHNLECIRREYVFDLQKATERKEIVDGLVKAIQDIDSIITTIKSSKSSDDARKNLITKFKFTDNQAKAIVDMRLGKLAHLEGVELNNELKELKKTITNCNKVLGSEKEKQKIFISRLDEFTTKYGWERRTQVYDIDTSQEVVKVIKSGVSRPKEEFIIALGDDNTIRRIKLTNFSNRGKNNVISTLKIPSREKVVLISNKGMMYKVPINKISLGTMMSSGDNIATLINLQSNEKIIKIDPVEVDQEFIIFITKKGLIKKLSTKDCHGLSKTKGAVVMKVNTDDEIVIAILSDDDSYFPINTTKRQKLVVLTNTFKVKGRSAGGTKLGLKKGEEVIGLS